MSWRSCKLEDVVDFFDHMRIPLSTLERDKRQGEFPYYGAQGVIDSIDDFIFDGEYVLIAEDGANLITRKQPIAQIADGHFWVNNHAHVVRAKPGVSMNYFVNKLINSMNLTGYVTGVAQPKLSQKNLRIVDISIPSFSEQQSITSILSAYDDLTENNRRRIQLLEQAARLLYREWFVHLRFPGHEHVEINDGVPEGWAEGVVADFYSTGSGGTPSRKNPDFYTGEIPWVKTQELTGGFILSTGERITDEAVKRSSAKLFPRHTVLIAMYGATIGQTAILSVPSTTNQACCAVIQKKPGTSYAHAYLFFSHYKTDLVGLGQGAAQNNVSQQVIKSFKMVLPRKELMEAFLESVSPLFEQVEILQKSNISLVQARDLLLPRLMNGEVAV